MRLLLQLSIASLFLSTQTLALTLSAVGDVMPGSAWPFSSELPPDDGRQLLSAARHLFTGQDVVFANLEGVLIDDVSLVRPCPPTSTSCFRFGIPDRYADHLKNAGFNVINLANNHMHDFDEIGRQLTLRSLDQHGLTGFGTLERPSTTQILTDGTRIGWVGFAPHTGVNRPDLQAIRDQVSALKRTHDLVFMSMHVGGEGTVAQRVTRATEMYLNQDRGDPYAFAHAAIDAGADLVLGHGPHVLRGMELYKGRLIAYSLGNFSTYGRFNLKGVNGLTGVLSVTLDPHGEFISGHFSSMRQDRNSEAWQRGITPVPDLSGEALNLLRTLSKEDFPESVLVFEADGRLTRPDAPALPLLSAPPAAAKRRAVSTALLAAAPRQPVPTTWGKMRTAFQSYYLRSRNAVRNLANN